MSAFRLWLVLVSIVLSTAALSACSHPEFDRAQSLAVQRTANLRIACSEGRDCTIKWARALQWVSDHAAFKIRIANDSIITTEGPLSFGGASTESAINVNRVPLGDGSDEISFRSGCANEFGCVPTHEMLLTSFADFVNAGAPPAAAGLSQHYRLGVGAVALDATTRAALHLTADHGLIVVLVEESSPAAAAGIRKSDVLLSLAGQPLSSVEGLQGTLATIPASSRAVAHIWRSGTEMDVQVQF